MYAGLAACGGTIQQDEMWTLQHIVRASDHAVRWRSPGDRWLPRRGRQERRVRRWIS